MADHAAPISPLRRLISIFEFERREIYAVAVYALAIGILSLAIPIAAMVVVNTTAMGTLVQQLIVVCGVLFACLALAATLRLLQVLVVEYIQRRIFVRVVGALTHRLSHLDIRTFDRRHGPEFVNRFFEILTVQKVAVTLLLDGLAVLLQMSVGLLLLAFYHQILLGFDLILLAGLSFVLFAMGRGGTSTSIRESVAKYEVAGWIEELARHPVAFKAPGGNEYARARSAVVTGEYLERRADHFRVVMRQFIGALALQVFASTVLLGLGGWLVIEGQLSLGQLVAAEIIVTLIVGSFTKLGKQLEKYYDVLAAADKLGHLLDLPIERDTGNPHSAIDGPIALKIRNAMYDYGTGTESLADFSADIEAGEIVAITGGHGAGKSTLLDLIYGLRSPNRGYIELAKLDLRDWSLGTLRSRVALVRGSEVFDGTILENLRIGRESIPIAKVREALDEVHLLGEISALPEGFETRLVAGGAPLSLGQSIRLMIARAFLLEPGLLLIDEALDALSSDVRDSVVESILKRRGKTTVLAISHSPDIAAKCDRTIALTKKVLA